MTEEEKLTGLGGWLILVGLGIVFSPVKIVTMVFPIYMEIFSNGSWELLTTAGTQYYNSMWMPYLLIEMIVNIVFLVTWLYIAFLFFTKKKLFKKVYIAMLVLSLLFIFLDAVSIRLILPDEPIFDPDTTKELIRGLIAVLIWVPYVLVSKRVKLTFVN